MLSELLRSLQHLFWFQAPQVRLDDIFDLFQSVMLKHVGQGYKTMTMRCAFTLKLGSKTHTCGQASITTHEFAMCVYVRTRR